MITQTSLPEIQHRCPICDSWTETALCPACKQHEILLELVVAMDEAHAIAFRAYLASPHPAIKAFQERIAAVKSQVFQLAKEISEAAGVVENVRPRKLRK